VERADCGRGPGGGGDLGRGAAVGGKRRGERSEEDGLGPAGRLRSCLEEEGREREPGEEEHDHGEHTDTGSKEVLDPPRPAAKARGQREDGERRVEDRDEHSHVIARPARQGRYRETPGFRAHQAALTRERSEQVEGRDQEHEDRPRFR